MTSVAFFSVFCTEMFVRSFGGILAAQLEMFFPDSALPLNYSCLPLIQSRPLAVTVVLTLT